MSNSQKEIQELIRRVNKLEKDLSRVGQAHNDLVELWAKDKGIKTDATLTEPPPEIILPYYIRTPF